MTEENRNPDAIRRRQYLLVAGAVAVVLGGALVSLYVAGANRPATQTRPKSTSILAPGAQVDARDAWRGQADAQLRAIETRSREAAQRNGELEAQNRQLAERLKKLEQGTLTPLPPPPVSVPAARPNFGPDRLPPPPSHPMGVPPFPTPNASPATPAGIVSVSLQDPTPAKPAAREPRHYLPSGSFARALLLGGLDAPTGGQAQRDPQPVLLRLVDNAVLPNHQRARVRECFVVGAAYGDVSSERAYVRTETLSCVNADGSALDIPVKGYVAGEDGKAGLRGRLVSKQGQALANALLSGVASGIGNAFQQSATTMSVSPLGSTSTVEPGKQFEAGMGIGVGRAMDRLAQYYISLAEKLFPVIEVDAGRTVDVVLTQGVAFGTPVDGADAQAYPQLTQRNHGTRRSDDEDE